MKMLEDHEYVLGKKDGDKEIENILGMKLTGKYRTINVGDDTTLNESTIVKDKSYYLKKQEREQHEQRAIEDSETLLRKLNEDKKARKERKRKDL